MLNSIKFDYRSARTDKHYSAFHDLIPKITGKSSNEMSVHYTFPSFIVDWQLQEDQHTVTEPSGVSKQ